MNWSLWLDRFLIPLDDPGSRLFHLNILISLAIVLAWVLYNTSAGLRWSTFRSFVFRKKYWWNRSTKTDYQVYLLNSLLKVFLLIPLLDFSFHIARFVAETLEAWNGDFLGWKSSYPTLLVFTVVAFVWDDFLRFVQHVLMHKVPWLWRVHAMHHSARVLTPLTLFRNHPIESALATLRNSLSLGVATGVFIFAFESRFSVVTLFGVNILGFVFNLAGANLRHSHIPISFGRRVENFLISPKQHQIHHSRARQHVDKNFGVSLSIWDSLFGSLVTSEGSRALQMGIRGYRHRTFWQELTFQQSRNLGQVYQSHHSDGQSSSS